MTDPKPPNHPMSQQSGRDLIDTAPSVTCVIGAYNHAKYVVEALDSAFALTYPNLRIIIYDDASTDNTQQVIRDHLAATGRDDVLFVAHEQNKGLCASLNEMLALVNSDYVAFISADDLQVPERLSIQVERLEALGERYAMIYSNALRIDGDGNDLGASLPLGLPQPEGEIFVELLENFFLITASLLIRTDVIREMGGYDESLMAEDYDMSLKIARQYLIAYEERPLVTSRIVTGSLTSIMLGNHLKTSLQQHRTLSQYIGVSDYSDSVLHRRLLGFSKMIYLYGGGGDHLRNALRNEPRDQRSAQSALYAALLLLRVPGPWVRPVVTRIRAKKQLR